MSFLVFQISYNIAEVKTLKQLFFSTNPASGIWPQIQNPGQPVDELVISMIHSQAALAMQHSKNKYVTNSLSAQNK
jgi:hypothetical protein